ncbi:hypothetical protein Tco_0264456 [Tanacetum coccineum]
MSNGGPLIDHSRNFNSFSDSKYFVCSTCQKCVFNANHDDCITKFLKEVNSRAKVQSPKSRNNIKPAKRIPNVNKPERWISKGYRFSPNKSSAVHEKPNTPRSCLRWKPTGRIFKIAGLRWIPTRKMFTDSTTKVDSEPPNGSNDDITNPYECDQTLNVSAGTLNLSADNTSGPAPQRKEKCTIQCALSSKEEKSSICLQTLLTISTLLSSHLMSMLRMPFSSTTTPDYTLSSPDYFPASPGNTYPNPSDDLSKYLLASLAILPFHDDPYMKIMQAYNATSNESPIPPPQALIAPPIVLPPSPVLPLSPMFYP